MCVYVYIDTPLNSSIINIKKKNLSIGGFNFKYHQPSQRSSDLTLHITYFSWGLKFDPSHEIALMGKVFNEIEHVFLGDLIFIWFT